MQNPFPGMNPYLEGALVWPDLDPMDLYERIRYDDMIYYDKAPPGPPLSPEDAAWLDGLLREKGLRSAAAATGSV